MLTRQDSIPKSRPFRRPIHACLILCLVCLFFVWGCLAGLRVYEPTPDSYAALYPICCSGMHNLMGKIDKTYRRAQRLPVRQMKDRNFAAMETHAHQIAAHAASIVQSADLSEANTKDAEILELLAERLGSHAKALASASANNSRSEVRKWFAKVTATCNSCHAAFRGSHRTKQDGGAG